MGPAPKAWRPESLGSDGVGEIRLLAHPEEARARPASFFLAPAVEKHLVLEWLCDTLLPEKVLAGVVAQDYNPDPGRAQGLWTHLHQEGLSVVGWQEVQPPPDAVGWTFSWGWTCIRDGLGRAALGEKVTPTCRRQTHTGVTQGHRSIDHSPQEGWPLGSGS